MFFDAINPNEFKHLENDSAMIQAAVDQAAQTGAAVVIPRINQRTSAPVWIISETINLVSSSVVYLDNCHLRLADGVFCNIFKNSHARTDVALKKEGRQYDIRISGFGNALLDGGVHNGLTEATMETNGFPNIILNTMIHFHNVERVVVENLRIVDHRWWGMTFHYCSEGRISNIDFECHHNLMNMDGVDIRTGCNRFLIENLTGSTGDDMLALTNIPFCARYDVEGMEDSIHTILIRNISAHLVGNHALVRLLNQGGRQLYNIQIEGVIDRSVEGADYHRPYAAIRIGDMYYNYDKPMAKLGDTRGIIIRDVTTRAQNGVYVACTLQDSIIDGVQMYGDAGIGVCFNTADVENISVQNLQYTGRGRILDTDHGKIIQTTNNTIHATGGFYFHNSTCKRLQVGNMTMGSGADAVFVARGSQVDLTLSNLSKAEPEMPLVLGDGISITEK